MTAPPITVVTPCRDYGRYLPDCLASVAASTYRDYEHIVVLDGCTDDSAAVVSAAMDRDPRVSALWWADSPPRGVAAALNYGIAQARSPWVLVLAADDWIEPGYLAAIHRATRQTPAPDVVCAPCYIVGDGAPRVYRYPRYDRARLTERHQLPGSAAFRREVWARVGGYDETMRHGSDWDFWVRADVSRPLTVVQLDRPYWHYRQHPAQLSTGWQDRLPALLAHLRSHLPTSEAA